MRIMDVNTFVPSHTEVLPGLWLGNEASSQSEKFVRGKNISFIVNCSKSIPNKFEGTSYNIAYLRLNVNDPGPLNNPWENDDNIQMITLIPQAIESMRLALRNGQNILVHCHAGAQRSASVVIYYLITYGHFTVGPEFNNLSDQEKKKILYHSSVNYLLCKRPFVYYGGLHNNFKYALEQILNANL
jgi:protein-tyrosine phosphatase